jgi:tetratricopeptide (TPR) repeat protein
VRALLTVAALLLLPASPSAQAKDDFARAVVDAINADQAPPESRRAAMAAARAAMIAGLKQWDAAVAKVEAGLAEGIKTAPSGVASQMHMALGAVYLERGRFQAAAAQFARAAVLNPSAAEPHAFRGIALEHMLSTADAAEEYRQAWQRDKASAVYAYRFLRASRGQPDPVDARLAREALLRAVEAPGGPPFHLLTVQLLGESVSASPMMPVGGHAGSFEAIRRGRYDEAVDRLQVREADVSDVRLTVEAVAAGGPLPLVGAPALLARIGRDAHLRLDLDAAVGAYERLVTIVPNDSAAHYDLANVYRSRDDGDAAIVEAAAAALLDPAASKPLVLIGQLHAVAGRDEDARRVLQRAVAMAPEDAEARYALSRALLRTGRTADAQRELDVFRQLQAKAMEEQRQQFEDNFRKIEETLKPTAPAGTRP